ncbi:MAG: hypothetical protein OXB84_05155 [Halobacteriovoraceae bacterium]|nr:hypothetical protein [Halobacteriovoraceae bacterium]
MFNKLINWSKKEHSVLPWRKNRSLYTTLVSEFMLQQTNVSTVINHYDNFIKSFPNISSLASSSQEYVLKNWQGLGYYKRAKNLHKAAIDIVNNYNKQIPQNYKDLTSIKGIGEYTANAILAIGYNKPALALDANIERVLSRIYLLSDNKGKPLKKKIYTLFSNKKILQNIEKLGSRALNESLMDLGRVFCHARKTNCGPCPVKTKCMAYIKNTPLKFPIINHPTKKEIVELELLRIFVAKNDKILAYRKKENEWLAGQLEIPTFIVKTPDISLKQYPWLNKKINLQRLKFFKTTITKYKIKNYILTTNNNQFNSLIPISNRYKYFSFDLQKEHYSTATTKAINLILKK